MIYDLIENIHLYEKALPQLKQIKEIFEKTTECGRYTIDDKTYYVLSEYGGSPFSGKYEFHKKYIDVQFLLDGEELIKVAPLKDTTPLVPYDEEKDAGFCESENASELYLKKGVFAVFFPEDAHAPGIAVNTQKIKKIVLKLQIE